MKLQMIPELDSPLKKGLFVLYIVAWAAQGIMVHRATQETDFKPASVITLQELMKLGISLIFVGAKNVSLIPKNFQLFAWYLVPATLYAVYNSLTFFALGVFDPTTYFVLMQFRIITVGLFSVIILGKRINPVQWIALFCIMLGAMYKELFHLVAAEWTWQGYSIVLLQITLSVLAGLVNEKILKQVNVPTPVHNVFMYTDSLILLLGYEAYNQGSISFSLEPLTNAYLLPIVLNSALIGIITSFFLKHLNSVLKSIASAIELWLTAVLSAWIFGYPIDVSTILGIAIVSLGVYLYSWGAEAEHRGRDRHIKPVTAAKKRR